MIRKIILTLLTPLLFLNVTPVSNRNLDEENIIYVSLKNNTPLMEDGTEAYPYASINTALNSIIVEDGVQTVVSIDDGIYLEEIIVSNLINVEIRGAGKGETVIAPNRLYNETSNGVTIDNSHYITVKNLTIDGYANQLLGSVPTFRDGVYFSPNGGNNNTFDNIEVRNVDRRGISVWPATSKNNRILNSTVYNVTGAMTKSSGGIGINFNGTGVIDNNNLSFVQSAIIVNANEAGSVTITNNEIKDFVLIPNWNMATGITVTGKNWVTIVINDNKIESTSANQVGMYLNDSFGSGSSVSHNEINLSGEFSVGIDILNERNTSQSYEVSHNIITVGKYSTGIAIANVAPNIAAPFKLNNNSIVNTGNNDNFINTYDFGYFWNRNETIGREVGILVSTSTLTKRVVDTDSLVSYLQVNDNIVDGFKEAIVYVRDEADTGSLNDITLGGNRLSNFQQDFVFGELEKVGQDIGFNSIEIGDTLLQSLRDDSIFKRTVTYISNGGTTVAPVTDFTGSQLPTFIPVREGYSFAGWFTDSNYTIPFNSNTIPNANLKLYARWTRATFVVDFVDYNNQLIKRDIVEYGQYATSPPSPTRDGYNFVGWSQLSGPIYSNLIVRANYQAIEVSTPPVLSLPPPVVNVPPVVETPPPAVIETAIPSVPVIVQVPGGLIEKFEVKGLDDAFTLTAEDLIDNAKPHFEVNVLKLTDVPQVDKAKIDQYFSESYGTEVPRHLILDMSLFKKGDSTSNAVTNTLKPVTVQFVLPENMRGFQIEIIRIHNGVLEVLPHDYDGTTNIITFETDRFSTYAIVEKLPGTQIVDGEKSVGVPYLLYLGVPIAVIALGGAFYLFKRKQAQ